MSTSQRIIIIGGISGAGCSTALKALEDFHFATVGRLPVDLIDSYIKEKRKDPSALIAIMPEIKSRDALDTLLKFIKDNDREQFQILFIDASDDSIVRRYSETRRPHPDFARAEDKTLIDAIKRERRHLVGLKQIANLTIDTTNLTVHDLKREISKFVESNYTSEAQITINFMSFGFKHGAPQDCDLLIDVRFLPNPFFEENLKSKTGLDEAVSNWVLNQSDTQEFLKLYTQLLQFLIPKYAHEGKAYLNIGVGCTGGKHRSVAIVEELSKKMSFPKFKITKCHRDLEA